jgi:type I restriction enzyme S subunit
MSSDWRPTTIEEIAAPHPAALATGPFGSSIGSKFFTDFGMPVIRGSNLSADVSARLFDEGLVFVSDEKAKQFQRSMAKRGDLVFTCWGTINQVGLIDSRSKFDRYIVSNKQMKLSVDLAKADPRFIYYLFSGPEKQAEILDNGIGSSVPGFNLGQLKRHEILLPSLVEQIQIANLLEMLDDRINLLRETNATLEAIAQALFKSWFVDFDPVRAKMEGRAPEGMNEVTAALFPDGFEESAFGLVPRGWAMRTMADVSAVGIGKTPPRKEQHWFSEDPCDVRWVSIRDMGAAGVYAKETSEFLTRDAVERFNVRLVPANTVLMSFKMTIGRVAITDGEMTTNEAIAHFKLLPNAPLTAEYIYLHLKQFDFSTLSSTSSIADAVNSKTVREIPIRLPEPAVLSAFQKQVGVIFEALRNGEQKAQTLATLRDNLLPRLISGQLRLLNAGSVAPEPAHER